ncbi:hypothetical protein GCM10022396_34250 [Flavivirga amylovorans]
MPKKTNNEAAIKLLLITKITAILPQNKFKSVSALGICLFIYKFLLLFNKNM